MNEGMNEIVEDDLKNLEPEDDVIFEEVEVFDDDGIETIKVVNDDMPDIPDDDDDIVDIG